MAREQCSFDCFKPDTAAGTNDKNLWHGLLFELISASKPNLREAARANRSLCN